ncbi:MAG: alpha-ketoglutarate-dependent dioxygenase AlkB [Polyangiaceae bacterium]
MTRNGWEENLVTAAAPPPLRCHELDTVHCIYSGELPPSLRPNDETVQELWRLHPSEFPDLVMNGRIVKAPRWQQAYGKDYRFSGRVSRAQPVPPVLAPLLGWARSQVDARLNGLLLNWYDASLEHYIGKHRDKTTGLVDGAPIVTISLGAARVFRLRPWRAPGARDFAARHGTVFVMPFNTNRAWTHEVPHFARGRGRRISVTIRAFTDAP